MGMRHFWQRTPRYHRRSALGHREIFTRTNPFNPLTRVLMGLFRFNRSSTGFWIKPTQGFFLEVFDRHEEDSPGMNRKESTEAEYSYAHTIATRIDEGSPVLCGFTSWYR